MAYKKNFNALVNYLNWYYLNCQKNIALVYRGTAEENWARRCQYLGKDYHPKVPYNHRSILDCEVIIEYDQDNAHLNELLANKVIQKLKNHRVSYAKWFSGGKSSHVHILLKVDKAKNLSLLKRAFMKYYGTFFLNEQTEQIYDRIEDVPPTVTAKRIVPDLQLCGAHLIRAEFGIHEKTQYNKELYSASPKFPELSIIHNDIWREYEESQKFSVSVRMGQQTKDISESALVKQLLDTVNFKENMDDGRERLLFMLTHVLKSKYKCHEDLGDFLWTWYNYSGGRSLDEATVRGKVKYHYYRSYPSANWEQKLKELLEELIGREQLTLPQVTKDLNTS